LGLRYIKNDPRAMEDPQGGVKGAYLLANALSRELMARSGRYGEFELLGEATDAHANARAQELANVGRLVVAARQDTPEGHVALVIPGQQSGSSKWDLMRPPMSASWLHNH